MARPQPPAAPVQTVRVVVQPGRVVYAPGQVHGFREGAELELPHDHVPALLQLGHVQLVTPPPAAPAPEAAPPPAQAEPPHPQ